MFRQKEKKHTAFATDIQKAWKDGKPQVDIQALEHKSYVEQKMIDEEISILTSDYLIRKARRRFVFLPSRETDEMWEHCEMISTRYVLTNQGISQLQSSLRKRLKEQVEIIMLLLAALTGIIGAVTGFVAVLMK